MMRCTKCQFTRTWKLADGRMKCRRCGFRFKIKSVWESSRLSDRTKTKLVEFFALGVPVYRMRFRGIASAPAIERFFRLIRACCTYEEHCRVPFEGAIECDESSFGGHRKGKRGWGAADRFSLIYCAPHNNLANSKPGSPMKHQRVIPFAVINDRLSRNYFPLDRRTIKLLFIDSITGIPLMSFS